MYSTKEYELESCYVCNFDPKVIIDELNLESNIEPETLILVGYKNDEAKPSDRHSNKKRNKRICKICMIFYLTLH